MSQLNRTRINNVLKRMTEAGVEQMIVTSPVSIFYLTGEMVHPGERCLALYLNTDGNVTLVVNQLHNYIKLDGAKVVFFHDTEDPVAILAKEVKPGKLGVDKEWPARFLIHMMELRPDAPVMNGSIFVDMTRMIKDAEEQEKLRRSSAMNYTRWRMPERPAVCRERQSRRERTRCCISAYPAWTARSSGICSWCPSCSRARHP